MLRFGGVTGRTGSCWYENIPFKFLKGLLIKQQKKKKKKQGHHPCSLTPTKSAKSKIALKVDLKGALIQMQHERKTKINTVRKQHGAPADDGWHPGCVGSRT